MKTIGNDTFPPGAPPPDLSNIVLIRAPQPSVVALLDAEWEGVLPKLRRIARGKCRRRRWGDPDELCAAVYFAIRVGSRPWDPAKYALLAFAKGTLRSLFSTESRAKANDRTLSFEETKHVGELAHGYIPDPERELILREEALDLKELIAEVRRDLREAPPTRRALFEIALEGEITGARDQAAALGVTPERIHQARHFLAHAIHRAALRPRISTLAEEEVVAGFAPLPSVQRRFVGFTVRVILGIATGSPRYANDVALVFAPSEPEDAPPSSAGVTR